MHLLRLFLLGLSAMAFCQLSAQASDYKVYFCDADTTFPTVQAYVWQDVQNSLTTWEKKDTIMRTYEYVELSDGKRAQVFSYSFSWDKTPQNILFFRPEVKIGKEIILSRTQSQDYTFCNGALYNLWGEKDSNGTLKFERKPIEPTTIYFADRNGWGASKTLVHAWNDIFDYTPWNANEPMAETGKFVKIDNGYFPLYRYDLYWMEEATKCLFRCGSQQTGDLTLAADAVYYFDGDKVPVTPLESPEIVDEIPTVTVYFADTGRWGAENTKVHVWGSAGDLKPWAQNESMTETGKLALVDDIWSPVYSYTFVYNGKVTGLLFHHVNNDNAITADCTLAPDGLYYFSGKKKPVTAVGNPTFYDTIPEDARRSATFYVNLGANQMMTDLWKEPCAHVWAPDADFDYEASIPAWGSDQYNAERMEKVRDGLYRITVDDVSAAADIIFYYYRKASIGDGQYVDRLEVHPASRSPYYDPTHWTTFMYDIGVDCVHQSYLTPEEYTRQWASLPEALYVTGNRIVTGIEGDDPRNCVKIDADEGVYINKFTLGEGDVAQFKLSCFDVMGIFRKLGLPDDAYEFQRGWATFNMGIIGCQQPTGDPDWYDEFIYSPGNGQSRQVKLPLNHTMTFNNYTQYPWRIDAGTDGTVEAGDYWLVVDLHDPDHSVTLLTFDPNPSIEMNPGSIHSVPLPAESAARLHDQSALSATAQNGPVYFDMVNIVSGQAVIQKAPGNDLLNDNLYSVVYTVYLEGVPVARYDGVPEIAEIPYMTAGQDADVALRARYTHQGTGVSFCSRMARGKVSAESPSLPEPQSENVTGYIIVNYEEPEADGNFPIGGAATLPFSLADDPGELAFFPDYKILSVTTSEGQTNPASVLFHSDHALVQKKMYPDYLGSKSANPWLPAEAGITPVEWSAANNWPAYISTEGHLPLLVRELSHTERAPQSLSGEAVVRIDAVYPFLVQNVDAAARQGTAAGRFAPTAGAEANEISLPENLDGFTIIPMTRSTQARVSFGGMILTGIRDVESPEADAVYYTLDGIRLPAAPAVPGLYIRQSGTTVTKILLR